MNRSIFRRVLSGFAILLALILVGNLISYLGLARVEAISAETAPNSEQLVALQDYALSLSALSTDLERLFAIGGVGVEENIHQDLDRMHQAAASIEAGAPEALSPLARSLAQSTTDLALQTSTLIELMHGDAPSRDINEQLVGVYSSLDEASQLQKDLTQGTLDQLKQTLAEQQQIITIANLQMGVGAVVLLVVAAVVSLAITRTIVKPVSDMVASVTHIAEGDYSQEVNITQEDEIGLLAASFNAMIRAIRSRRAQLQAQTEQLAQSNKQLTIARREAEEASRLKDEFLSVMSHELRTPLNAVLGYQGILELMGQLDAESLEMVQRTQANARRLLDLINDVLDISRIEAGRMELVPMELNVDQFIQHIRAQMEVLAREKQLGFQVDIDPTMPPAILVDEDALTKILVNLLGNAFKFTEQGSVSLRLCAENDHMIIAVADTGIGIPVYMHETIFERFRQVDASSTRKHGGSGLGLSIVQQLCSLMGGKVTVDSDTGRGSTFTVILPLQPVAEAVIAA